MNGMGIRNRIALAYQGLTIHLTQPPFLGMINAPAIHFGNRILLEHQVAPAFPIWTCTVEHLFVIHWDLLEHQVAPAFPIWT